MFKKENKRAFKKDKNMLFMKYIVSVNRRLEPISIWGI
jgi:hypothetical protein